MLVTTGDAASRQPEGGTDHHLLWFGTKDGFLGVVDATCATRLAHPTGIGCVRTLVQTRDQDGARVVLVGGEKTYDRREKERSASVRSFVLQGSPRLSRSPLRQTSAPVDVSTPVRRGGPMGGRVARQASLPLPEEAYPSPVAGGQADARAGHVLVWEATLDAPRGAARA